MALTDKLTAIGDAIREKNGSTELIPLADMPQAIRELSGDSSDTFWDIYQDNGNRTDYDYAFGGPGWTDETFKPKYNTIVKSGTCIFSKCLITNLKKILDDSGVVLDFSQMTSCNYPFKGSKITDVGVLDVTKALHLNYFLHQSRNLKSVEKVILNENGSQSFNSTYSFGDCEALEHMPVEGVIGQSVNLQWSPLDLESATSIIIALKNYAGTADAFKYKATFSATTINTLTAAGNTAPGGVTWAEYAASKGWGIE